MVNKPSSEDDNHKKMSHWGLRPLNFPQSNVCERTQKILPDRLALVIGGWLLTGDLLLSEARKFNRNGSFHHQVNAIGLASNIKLKCLYSLLQRPGKNQQTFNKNEGLYSRLVSHPSSLIKRHIKWVLPSCGIISYYILWNPSKRHLLAGGTWHVCQEADIIPNSAKTCKHLLNEMTATRYERRWNSPHV